MAENGLLQVAELIGEVNAIAVKSRSFWIKLFKSEFYIFTITT